MRLLSYKGYLGYGEMNDYGQVFGQVTNLESDIITFKSEDESGCEQAFKDSINEYINYCKELGEQPEQPKSNLCSNDIE